MTWEPILNYSLKLSKHSVVWGLIKTRDNGIYIFLRGGAANVAPLRQKKVTDNFDSYINWLSFLWEDKHTESKINW